MYKRTVQVSPTESRDMFLIFHVDDILVSAHPSCAAAVTDFKTRFMQLFQAKDEGLVSSLHWYGCAPRSGPHLSHTSFAHSGTC